MNKSKKLIFIVIGLVILTVIGSFSYVFYNHRSSESVENAIQRYLNRQSLRSNVSLGDVSVSLLSNNVKIKNSRYYSFDSRIGERELNIEEIELLNFKNTAAISTGHLKVKNIGLKNNVSPMSVFDTVAYSGINQLPPLSLEIKWNFDLKKNDGTLFVVLNQPLAFKASLDLNLPDSLSIFELVDNFFNDVEYDIGNNDLVTYFMFISPLTELWLNMNFTDFKLHVQDDGLVKRYTTMVRRQSKISDFSKGTDAIKTRNQNFDKGFYEEINTECNERSAEATSQIMRYVFDIKFNNLSSDQCIAVTDFLFNKKATIKLESDVNRPFNMYSLINAGDLNKASGRVNLQVYN